MAEAFEPITTQEAFDAAVEQRLAPYADYNEIKAQNEKYAGQIVELNSRSRLTRRRPSRPASPMKWASRSIWPSV